MSPWTSSPCSVMLYGFTERGCLSRRILITCITSWTSPFSRSLNRSPITPSETYSTSPSREDRGLSSFTSAVKMHVASVDLSCLQSANSFSRRSLSSANSMFNKVIESIATRDAPLRLMNSGSSDRTRVTVVFASAGSSLTMWSFFCLMYAGRSQPNDAAFAMTESASSSRYMYRWRLLDRADVRHSNTKQPSVLSIRRCSCRASRIPRVSNRYTSPFQRFATRWSPLIVVTRSLSSTMSEMARSVSESITIIASCAFSSKKVSSLRPFVHQCRLRCGRVNVLLHPGSHVPPEENRGPAREAAIDDAVQVCDPRRDLPNLDALERFRQRIHAEVDTIPR